MSVQELERFHHQLMQDVEAIRLAEEEGGSQEQSFTRIAVDLLTDAGECENVRIAYGEGHLGTSNQNKINAYAEPDNYETLDLFITIYNGTPEIQRVKPDEITTARKRITNFYRMARSQSFRDRIEETSEIWEFVQTVGTLRELSENLVRINAYILTDGRFNKPNPDTVRLQNIPVFYKVIDVEYLFNISKKSHAPIEINFREEGFTVPCIQAPTTNENYQSYLAIIPGSLLATIYERYGSRLLEQNVRSFLQFTGKVNKGIRDTIVNEPHMFLAFNNGIAATAESVSIDQTENGPVIVAIRDFQIVNGGQTTASIYHTNKKVRKPIDEVFVQVKLTVVNNEKKFTEIVSKIAEYSNTQNKVQFSELSSNIPFHVDLEKISRGHFAPQLDGQPVQTRWFYERARGQYRNARLREGITAAQKRAFDLKNPRGQVITKADLAKFVNVYKEVNKANKLVIGPFIVVRGNEKNYVQFITHNKIETPDVSYFEDVVAKAILFKTAEKIYGVKPNALGDLRYVTVPYSIAYLAKWTDYKIDLYKIWRNQAISDRMKDVLRDLMVEIEQYIKTISPGSLYVEFAKKEDCWKLVREQEFEHDLRRKLQSDLMDDNSSTVRMRRTDAEIRRTISDEEHERLAAVSQQMWKRIEDWGRSTAELTPSQLTTIKNLPKLLRSNGNIDSSTRTRAIQILNHAIEKVPELFETEDREITDDDFRHAMAELLAWDRRNRTLRDRSPIEEIVASEGPIELRKKTMALLILKTAERNGYSPSYPASLVSAPPSAP